MAVAVGIEDRLDLPVRRTPAAVPESGHAWSAQARARRALRSTTVAGVSSGGTRRRRRGSAAVVDRILVRERWPPCVLRQARPQHPLGHPIRLHVDGEQLLVVATAADDHPVEAVVEGEVLERRQPGPGRECARLEEVLDEIAHPGHRLVELLVPVEAQAAAVEARHPLAVELWLARARGGCRSRCRRSRVPRPERPSGCPTLHTAHPVGRSGG